MALSHPQAFPPTPTPNQVERPAAAIGAADTNRTRRGPTPFGVAFGLAAIVMVGGVSFAAGRQSADDGGTSAAGLSAQAGALGLGLDNGQLARQRGAGARQQAQAGTAPAAGAFGGAATSTVDEAQIAVDAFGAPTGGDGFGTPPADTVGERPAVDGFGRGSGPVDPEGGAASSDFGIVSAPPAGTITQAPADAAPERSGLRGGGQPGGFGFGATEGNVTGIGDVGITVESADGNVSQFFVDETTSFAFTGPADPTSIVPGDLVQITPAGIDGGIAAGDGDITAAAITILPAGTDLGLGRGTFGGGRRGDGQAGERGPAADGDGPRAERGNRGPGGRAGVGLGGSVVSIGDSSLTLALASGDELSVAIDSETSWQRQTAADAADLALGDAVSVLAAGGGFGRDTAAVEQDGPRQALRVTVSRSGTP